MSPRTCTASPDDKRLWRCVLALAPPDRGGDSEAFVWLQNVRESLCTCEVTEVALSSSRRREEETSSSPDRVPYDADLGAEPEFWTLTHRALSVGHSVEEPHRLVLALLIDCGATDHGRRAARQMRGATYRQLAAIGHSVGMSKSERARFYAIARVIPLSDQHAHYILGRLKGAAA